MKCLILWLSAADALAQMPPCNTMRIVGEDLVAVGNTLANTGQ
jgi:predicted small secreted protein